MRCSTRTSGTSRRPWQSTAAQVLEPNRHCLAQRRAGRSEIARESAVRILTPLLLLVVIVGGFIVVALRRGLLPLEATASLLADAAHGLRTPATAVRLQAQLIETSPDERTRAAAMVDLKVGIRRSQRLIEQLLQVSRCGGDGEVSCSQPCDLAKLARSVVSLLSINAEHTGVDLGADAAGEVFVSGPGIEPSERERVFDRFYRGDGASARYAGGSGLGLSIVKAIADHRLAEVSLHTPANGIGLEVRVVFMFQDAAACLSF